MSITTDLIGMGQRAIRGKKVRNVIVKPTRKYPDQRTGGREFKEVILIKPLPRIKKANVHFTRRIGTTKWQFDHLAR